MALENDDIATAERLAHTVKGAAGNMGATEMKEKAHQLDDALKNDNKDEYDTLLKDFEDTLKTLSVEIKKADLRVEPEVRRGTAAELSSEELFSRLKQLQPLLKQRQPKKCISLLEEILEYKLPLKYADKMETLNSLIKRYKFKDAEAILFSLVEI